MSPAFRSHDFSMGVPRDDGIGHIQPTTVSFLLNHMGPGNLHSAAIHGNLLDVYFENISTIPNADSYSFFDSCLMYQRHPSECQGPCD